MRCLVAVFAALLLAPPAFAGTSFQSGGGTTADDFLRIGRGPRPAGMGDAFVAVADDVNAVNWNPAGLTSLSDTELQLLHTAWLLDVSDDDLAYAQPAGSTGGLGFSLAWLHASAQRFDSSFSDIGSVDASSYGFTFGYGNRLDSLIHIRPVDIQVGVAVKLLAQRLDANSDYGFGADLAAQWLPSETLSFGAAIQNLGGGTAGYLLPVTFRLGGAVHYRAVAFPRDKLILSIEGVAFVETHSQLLAGLEYRWALGRSAFSLRAGYRLVQDTGLTAGLTFGVGLDAYLGMLRAAFDYAYVKYGDLGNTHRMGLTLRV